MNDEDKEALKLAREYVEKEAEHWGEPAEAIDSALLSGYVAGYEERGREDKQDLEAMKKALSPESDEEALDELVRGIEQANARIPNHPA